MCVKFNDDEAHFVPERRFDSKRMRHYVNGELTVLHCHHYASLFSQLADDAKLLHGDKLMCQAAEETFYPILSDYFANNGIRDIVDRTSVAEDYYRFIGMGEVRINVQGNRGTAEMLHSHVDEGWLKKWNRHERPVNFIGQGFLAAAFAAISGSKIGSYTVSETQSIVSGASTSKFEIENK
jgi:predicted hydrocarbon binding protein